MVIIHVSASMTADLSTTYPLPLRIVMVVLLRPPTC